MNQKRASLLLICSILLAAVVVGAWWTLHENEKPELGGIPKDSRTYTIGYQELSLYRHVFTAQEKGFFREEGLNVRLQPFTSANRMMEALIGHQLDATGLTNLQVALSVEAKDPDKFSLSHFLVWGSKSYPDFLLTCSPKVRTPQDLHDATLGLHPGSAVKGFAETALRHLRVNTERVTTIELEPSLMPGAAAAGRIDALYCMDPVATALVQKGTCRVLVKNPMQFIFPPPVPISATAFSQRLVTEEPKVVAGLVRAIDRAIEYMRRPGTEEEIVSYIAKYTATPPAEILTMNTSEYWVSGEIDYGRVQALADRFHQIGIVPAKLDAKGMLLNPSLEESR